MAHTDVQDTLDAALAFTGVRQVAVRHHPRLLSDNGSAYLSSQLAAFLKREDLQHTRGQPYHPMTQGKIERYHLTMKNIVNLQNYYLPEELEREIAAFVDYYNHHRYHESLNNLTPADVYFGRAQEVLTRRQEIKQRTLEQRRLLHRQAATV